MKLDSFGRIIWPTTLADIDSDRSDPDNDPYPLTIRVCDDRGGCVLHPPFSVLVDRDTESAVVELRVDPNPADPDEQVTVLVSAVDNVGVTDLELTWCQLNAAAACIGTPTNLPLDAKGVATISFATIANYKFTATARDAAGNPPGTASATLAVFNTHDLEAPDVSIIKLVRGAMVLEPADGATVTAPMDVIGSVTDAENNIMSWTLEVAAIEGVEAGDDGPDDADFRIIAQRSCPTPDPCPLPPVSSGILGQFDPTMLPNGPYVLRLSATDAGLHESSTEATVNVTGNLKLGNFRLSFTDLSIPVSGLPIAVSRSYDTLNAGKDSDFGFGWKLDLGDMDLKVSRPPGQFSLFGNFLPYRDGTRVTLTGPDGKPQSFTFRPWAECRFFCLVQVWHPQFIPDAGVYTRLTVKDVLLDKIGDEYTARSQLLPYNPADSFFGGSYTLETLDGIRHKVDATTGKLLTISDRNDNTLTLKYDGIESDTGRKITFERDFRNRITKITDPRGNFVSYRYDARGDLVAVTDRIGNSTADPLDRITTCHTSRNLCLRIA